MSNTCLSLYFQYLCDPCSTKYDNVVHLEELSKDLDQILPRFNAMHLKSQFPEVNGNNKTKEGHVSMYSDVPMSVLQPVLDKFRVDADMFGYSFDNYISSNYN